MIKGIQKVLYIDIEQKTNTKECILGIKTLTEDGRSFWASAVFNKEDIRTFDEAKTNIDKLAVYHAKKKKIVFSMPKQVGCFDFADRNFTEPSFEDFLDVNINFVKNIK